MVEALLNFEIDSTVDVVLSVYSHITDMLKLANSQLGTKEMQIDQSTVRWIHGIQESFPILVVSCLFSVLGKKLELFALLLLV